MLSLSSLAQALGLDRAALSHGLRLALAAWLAFTIAVLLGIHNPYWAAMPVWVVAQATRGLMIERGFFRVLGTLGGAAFGLALLHFSHLPYVQLLCLGLWIAGCATLTHVLRGVHAYGAMLCGITGAVVVLPSIMDPSQSLSIAVARIECTLLGVVVVTLVTSWFTPESERQVFYRRVRLLAGDAISFAAESLSWQDSTEMESRLLAQISEVEASASLVSAGSLDGYRRLQHVHALVYASVELMAASQALRGQEGTEEIASRLRTLAQGIREDAPGQIPHPAWTTAIDTATPASERLARALNQLMAAELALFIDPESSDAKSFGRKAVYLAPHYNWAEAARTGLLCGLATFAAASLSYASGWRPGQLVALGVSIFSLILSVMPLPQKIAPKMTLGVLSGVTIAIFYRLVLQPHLDTTWLISLSLVPFVLIGAFARLRPAIAVSALDANMCFLLASQAGLPSESLPGILGGAAALVIASVIVTLAFTLRPTRPEREARAVARLVCRDLEQLLKDDQAQVGHWNPQASRHILRLMLHLGRAGVLKASAPAGLLSAINLGHAFVELRSLARDPSLGLTARARLNSSLENLALFSSKPAMVCTELESQAAALARDNDPSEVAAIQALQKTARALHASSPLLEFATG